MKRSVLGFLLSLLAVPLAGAWSGGVAYPVVDTGQVKCYGTSRHPGMGSCPAKEHPLYGQDAQYTDHAPAYRDNGDGTVTDLVTGLMWQKAFARDVAWRDAAGFARRADTGGYQDWRVPTIKELYSLILFTGNMGLDIESSTPFIDTDFFGFEYGDESAGERFIDCQDWSSATYVDAVMGGQEGAFGVNFADGRIKCYPKFDPASGSDKLLYVRYVRGNSQYGINDLTDNGDGTISDAATGLMWSAASSDQGLKWEEALEYAQQVNEAEYLGFSDWRLPNIKELQSIVDYSRSPSTTDSPAIDPMFEVPEIEDNEYPFYWSNTTHVDGPTDIQYRSAAYISFGRALGWMEQPPNSGNLVLLDVHGAGAQRSDPKDGNPDDYPYGHGPQGDVIRIYNYVRLVRDLDTSSSLEEEHTALPESIELAQNQPNPFNSSTVIHYTLPQAGNISLEVFDLLGQQVAVMASGYQQPGSHSVVWQADNNGNLPSGIYFYRLSVSGETLVRRMTYLK